VLLPCRFEHEQERRTIPEIFNWREHLKVHPAADLFPLMSETELKELAEDIRKNGLQQPVIIRHLDGGSQLLDGRNRLDALALLGHLRPSDVADGFPSFKVVKKRDILTASRTTMLFLDDEIRASNGYSRSRFTLTDEYARNYIIAANIQRRHLTTEQKRELIAKILKADPHKSDRQIGKLAKVDGKTVAKVREACADIPHVETRTDTKGRQQPSEKKKPIHWQKRVHPDVVYNPEYEHKTAREILGGGVQKEPEIDHSNLRNIFLMNCAASAQAAVFHGIPTEELCAAARRTAAAWTKLAEEMGRKATATPASRRPHEVNSSEFTRR
jgi:hypothetical protein